MVFSSLIFLFFFLPLTLGIYYISPKKWRNLVLFLFSVLFYTWGEEELVLLLLISAIVDYKCAHLIDKGYRKLGLGLSLMFNLSSLFFFKYFNFFFENISSLSNIVGIDLQSATVPFIELPIGISFFTFQTMSYTIDVYRGSVVSSRNFINFGTYVTMFPQLVAGPIVRYIDVDKELTQRKVSINSFNYGVQRFIIGLSKKVLIANTLAVVADEIFTSNTNDLSSFYGWFGLVCYSLQIFFDFSGYSDMAIGLGKMFGFNFLENFNFPYYSKSIREFWQRWHMSLSYWFRDYLYIPLGGSQSTKFITYRNLLIVFLATGIWHGANWTFVVWGLWHGLFIIMERAFLGKILNKTPSFFVHFYVVFVVVIGWVFFRSDNMMEAKEFIINLFSLSSGNISLIAYLDFKYLNLNNLITFSIAIILCFPINSKVLNQSNSWTIFIKYIFLIILLFLCIIYLSAGTYNPFIYFKF